MKYTHRPLSDRTWLRPDNTRRNAQFDSDWSTTLMLLEQELDRLKATDVVIEADVTEADIRNNGMLRASARPPTPAVVLAFTSKAHGPMLYRADRYLGNWVRPGWQQNVRAIALTLQALRAVDRWGAVETGQQYAGFKALPAGRAMPTPTMTRSTARQVIQGFVEYQIQWDPPVDLSKAFRAAKRAAHPDFNKGHRDGWDQVTEAIHILEGTQ